MNWKKWPYWVRGGTIGLLLYVLSTVVLIPLSHPNSGCYILCFPMWSVPALIIISPFIAFQINWIPNSVFLFFGIPAIIYFLIFGLFSWVYGNIKGHRSTKLKAIS